MPVVGLWDVYKAEHHGVNGAYMLADGPTTGYMDDPYYTTTTNYLTI